MSKVIIRGQKNRDLDNKVRLTNGNLVIHKDIYNRILGTYIITSSRNSTKKEEWGNPAIYCSLINLSDGTIRFNEPSSRNTTEGRLLKHLTNQYNMNSDFNGNTIAVFDNNSYSMEIILNDREVPQ